jgi:hypothetical protein
LGVVYAIAFLVAINQILPLIGSGGLTPVNIFIDHVNNHLVQSGIVSGGCLHCFGFGILTPLY